MNAPTMEEVAVKMTIYLPDDLYARVKAADLNASAVCQRALTDELERRERLAELDAGMERHEVYTREGFVVAFTGRLLVVADNIRGVRDGTAAYLTRKHRIAVYDENDEALDQYNSLEEMTGSALTGSAPAPELVSAIADALSEKYVIELDI